MSFERIIKNCDIKFEKVCPLKWENLEETENEFIRHCEECKKEVYYCKSQKDARKHADLGHCIAKKVKAPNGDESELMGGVVAVDGDMEKAILEKLDNIDFNLDDLEEKADERCPNCSVLIPVGETNCDICGEDVL